MSPRGASASCRTLGYEVHWNAALHAFPGAPTGGAGEACADEVVSAEADSPQRCCALCAAAQEAAASKRAGGQQAARAACTSWSFFAPRCYWAPGCTRALAHRKVMWGAVAGLSVGGASRTR